MGSVADRSWYTIAEVAQILGVTVAGARYRVDRLGLTSPRNKGRSRQIPKENLLEMLTPEQRERAQQLEG